MLFICPFIWNPKISVGEKLLVIVARNWGKTCFSPPSSRNWVSLGESLGRKAWLSSLNQTSLRKGNVLFYQWRIELKWNSSMMWIPLTRELVVTTFPLKTIIWSEENKKPEGWHFPPGCGGGWGWMYHFTLGFSVSNILTWKPSSPRWLVMERLLQLLVRKSHLVRWWPRSLRLVGLELIKMNIKGGKGIFVTDTSRAFCVHYLDWLHNCYIANSTEASVCQLHAFISAKNHAIPEHLGLP